MKRLLLLTLLAIAMTVDTHGQGNSKLSPWLGQAVQQQQLSYRRAAAEGEDKRLTTVFVRTSKTLTQDSLQAYGATLYAQLGDISIVTIPLSQVGRLAAQPAVERIEANRRASVTLDTVPEVSNIRPVYQPTRQHSAFTGRGVVVGVVDVGFDLTHPTFYNNSQRTEYRIKAFWDQLAKGDQTTIGRLPVGCDYVTPADILAQGCATDGKDEGHGTHTAGIAAGSGYDSPYRGVAYESELCLVANAVTEDTAYIDSQDLYLYTSATDALAFKYCFDYAEQQGKPCVVSFSEGYTPYMDDDDLLYNDFLERLTGPGRIFVASAGNESRRLTYMEKPAGKEQVGAFLQSDGKHPLYRIKSDKPVAFSLYAYKDSNTPTHRLHIAADDERWATILMDTLFVDDDTLAVVINNYPSAFDRQSTVWMVQMHSNVELNKWPPLAIVISGQEQQAALMGSSTNALANLDIDPRWNDAQTSHNILSPGCLTAPICVGSTSYRPQFRNVKEEWVKTVYSNEQQGCWAPFSSVGPTLDGRTKPDVTAPGRNVISAYSSYYLEEHPDNTAWDVAYSDVDGRSYPWHADSGTSMSTPVVAGIIALWLQANPTLTPDDIMGTLRRTCRHPEEELSYPNNKYGYGDIDAYLGLLDVLGANGIKEISLHEPHDATLWAQDGLLHICFSQQPAGPIAIAIYTTGGQRVYQTQLTVSQSAVTLPLPTLSKGIYVVQLGKSGSALIRI